jgi:dihydroorotate dehydrogenase
MSPISKFTGTVYRHIAKPILFRISPDSVHTNLLKIGAFVARSSVLSAVLRRSLSYENTSMLQQTIHGITFQNPVGLSAGFDKNFVLPVLMKNVGFGFMEGGSITYRQCDGNPKPWFYRLPNTRSLVVHAGLANDGVDTIMKRLSIYPNKSLLNFPLNISVAKTNSPETCTDDDAVTDYTECMKAVKRSGHGNMITINISCPNTYGGEPFTTPERLEKLLTRVDVLKLKQPTFIKMPTSLKWPAFHELLRIASTHHIDGVIIGNLVKDRHGVNPKDRLPSHIKGGLSGKPTQKITNELICRTHLAYGKRFVIIGVGGIFSAEDAYEKIKAGAQLVELITGMIFEGPQLIGQINYGLCRLLKKDGYDHVSQAVGADAAAKISVYD